MTKEIAIHNLYALKIRSRAESDRDALDMAIKALKQQPCDAISRQAVLDMCKKEIDHISKNWQNYHSPSEAKSGFVYIVTNIHDLPSVTPQARWIPVSERLPEEGKTVIASTEHGVYPEARYIEKYGWECAYEDGADYWRELVCVTAWLPLPEPYGGEEK